MNIKNMPIAAGRALKKLGQDLRDARRRRRIPMQLTADRAGISRATLNKIEKGDQGVCLGAYARVLFVLGLISRLADLVDVRFDEIGLGIDMDHLPKRIRLPRRSP